jgi:hypothetical protein
VCWDLIRVDGAICVLLLEFSTDSSLA